MNKENVGCIPKVGTINNSKHILVGNGIGESVWFWVNEGWGVCPDSQWITKPVQMSILGWKYGRPA